MGTGKTENINSIETDLNASSSVKATIDQNGVQDSRNADDLNASSSLQVTNNQDGVHDSLNADDLNASSNLQATNEQELDDSLNASKPQDRKTKSGNSFLEWKATMEQQSRDKKEREAQKKLE